MKGGAFDFSFATAPKTAEPVKLTPPGIAAGKLMLPMKGDGTPVPGVHVELDPPVGNPVTPVTTGIGEHGGNVGGIGMKGRVGTAHRLDCCCVGVSVNPGGRPVAICM